MSKKSETVTHPDLLMVRLRIVYDHARNGDDDPGRAYRYVPHGMENGWEAFDRREKRYLDIQDLIKIPLNVLEHEMWCDA